MRGVTATLMLTALAGLSGCDAPSASGGGGYSTAVQSGAPEGRYENVEYGIAVDYSKDQVTRVDGPAKGYFEEGGWRVGVGPDQPGHALLVLRLKDSNEIRAGELRLGASRDPEVLAGCTEPDPWARPDSVGEASLDGVAFTTFQGGDAAMNHSRRVHAWRALHDGACYAIDLVVQGSNGQVYDPPREAPFSETRAFNDLSALLEGVHFFDRTTRY
ncbi:hypothetical protein [Alloalcanivorax gelatiniphagus]|uniref:Lipoprotein n=1 Tax=Alloalcanivorax gelatiniphagus TaxID=1194167 RepID=A0ABY2XKD1_9GAMM|nr:hypothetical protein [Alloalcanivorax gelatiniphagus]TMW11676.1 hypothetical protein FGS76_13955 [Alloalcanivorax gelatiniphagus]|tara:strand:+ start:2564 stop:3211 length:648 start_codon:yes stop_codon:yes gene_type:complete